MAAVPSPPKKAKWAKGFSPKELAPGGPGDFSVIDLLVDSGRLGQSKKVFAGQLLEAGHDVLKVPLIYPGLAEEGLPFFLVLSV